MTLHKELQNAVIKPAEYEAPGNSKISSNLRITPIHLLLFLLGLLCLAFIFFITFAKSIQVKTFAFDISNPDRRIEQASNIEIHTRFKLPIGNRFMVLPGQHDYTITAPGFEVLNDALNTDGERNQQFEFILRPLPGVLDITLNPDIEASVSIGDAKVGDLPGLINNIPAGLQTINVDAPLHRGQSRQIFIEGKEQVQTLEFTLEPAWAEVSLDSEPGDAIVQIDGQDYGTTPAVFKLEEGSHSLTVSAKGYKPYTTDLVVVAEQAMVMDDIDLKPADGILLVETTPDTAAVVLNGEFVGVSPISLNVASNDEHNLQVYKAGHELYKKTVNLLPDQKDTATINLQQDRVAVAFSIKPNDAEIYIDGVKRGQGSETLSLTTLQHQISVRKEGFASYEASLIPTKDNQQIVNISLQTIDQAFWANVPDQYTTDGGQTMLLFKSPGLVEMGSPRGESGRRQNEVTYSAQLTRHFYVSDKEVTNRQFREFSTNHNAGNYKQKSLDSSSFPAVNVSWQQAALYCNWLSAKEGLQPFYQTKSGFVSGNNAQANGYRLLTEVEWSWLARSKDNEQLIYPWGNTESVANDSGNFADNSARELVAFTLDNYQDGYSASAPVGRYSPNHRGLYDLGGNVSEWTNDWYSARGNLDAGNTNLNDPLGPDVGEFHVIRGGSWAKGYLPQLRLAYRDFGAKGKHDVGFRIARYVGASR